MAFRKLEDQQNSGLSAFPLYIPILGNVHDSCKPQSDNYVHLHDNMCTLAHTHTHTHTHTGKLDQCWKVRWLSPCLS